MRDYYFERKILRHVYKGIKNDMQSKRYNIELYKEYQDPDIKTILKIERLRLKGYLEREEQNEIEAKVSKKKNTSGKKNRKNTETHIYGARYYNVK